MLRAKSRTIPIENIKVPFAFEQTTPGREKVEKAKQFYAVTGQFDKPMLIDRNGYIFDGYARLTAAKELGLDKVPVVQIVPFKKKADEPTNKYEGMSNKQLDLEMCAKKGLCHVRNGGCRKHDCLFAGNCKDVTDANRAEVIQYLLEEDAASEGPEVMPAADKPKFKVGDKVKFVFTGYSFDGEIGTVQRVRTGNVRVSVDSKYPDTHEYFCLNTEIEPYAPSFDWDAFRAGKIAVHCDTKEKAKVFVQKCRENLSERATKLWEKGETNWNEYKEDTCYISDSDETLCYSPESFFRRSRYTIIDYPFSEQPAEPIEQKEPVKLYCVEDCICGYQWATEGNTYTIDSDGVFHGDRDLPGGYRSFDDFIEHNSSMKGKLFPLVKRPAKVGEWIYMEEDILSFVSDEGHLSEVVSVNDDGEIHNRGDYMMNANHYLVLDGYQPEPEKEPEYYNGKVVCTDLCGYNSGLYTVGMVYEIKDGIMHGNGGTINDTPVRSFNDWCKYTSSKFIEYKGEADD